MFSKWDYEPLKQTYKNQIETYAAMVEVLEMAKDKLKEFDGKVINVKLKKLLDAMSEKAYFDYNFDKFSQGNKLKLTIYCRNWKNVSRTSGMKFYDIDKESTIWDIPCNGGRFNYAATVEKIQEHINYFDSRIGRIALDLANIDKTIEEYNNICKAIEEFQKNHDSITRDTMRFDRI